MPQINSKNENLQNNPQRKVLLEWEFPEFIKYERTKKWYIIASIIVVLFLIYSVFSHNFLLAVIVMMAIFYLFLREKSAPKKIKFVITDAGIVIGENFHPFRNIKNFSIIFDPPEVKMLYLEFYSKIKPRFSISLENQDPNEVREILKEHIEENLERESESLSDALGRWLKI